MKRNSEYKLLSLLLTLALTIPAIAGPRRQIQNRKYFFPQADREVPYCVFVPSSYDKSKKTPLVMVLHGLGSRAAEIIRYPNLVEEAEKRGYILVAAEGINDHGWYGAYGKQGSQSDGDPVNLGELSEKDVLNVLTIAQKEFNIDDQRTYLMGHSMGGSGTWHLGMKYPEKWAALAPLASAGTNHDFDMKKLKNQTAVIVVHGVKDNLCPIDANRLKVANLKRHGVKYKYIEDPNGDHLDVAWENFPAIFDFFDENQKVKE
tara:strand:+ start:1291 stop:2073 length:783 start_codon:yes stop_codon:yes gene_type:complete